MLLIGIIFLLKHYKYQNEIISLITVKIKSGDFVPQKETNLFIQQIDKARGQVPEKPPIGCWVSKAHNDNTGILMTYKILIGEDHKYKETWVFSVGSQSKTYFVEGDWSIAGKVLNIKPLSGDFDMVLKENSNILGQNVIIESNKNNLLTLKINEKKSVILTKED